MIMLENFPKCIFCGVEGKEIYRNIPDRIYSVEGNFNLKRCPNCGLIWVDPRPTPEDIHKCYGNHFRGRADRADRYLFLKDFLRKNVLCGHYGYRHIHKRHIFCRLGHLLAATPILGSKTIYDLGSRFPHFKENGLIVDIGCGGGEYLMLMQKIGWRTLGIEPNSAAADATEKLGVPILRKTLEEAEIGDSIADQITMYHVIEHVPDPVSTIEKCFKILKKGGRLIVNMPNGESLGHKVFNEHWLPLDPPRHLFTFSPKSTFILFKKSPFKRFRIMILPRTAKYVYDNSVLISKNGKTDLGKTKSQKGWRRFAVKESLLCRLGVDCGEEMQIVAIK